MAKRFVYRVSSYSYEPCRGTVIKETEKQFKVFSWFLGKEGNRVETWPKEDCSQTIEEAVGRLVGMYERRVRDAEHAVQFRKDDLKRAVVDMGKWKEKENGLVEKENGSED